MAGPRIFVPGPSVRPNFGSPFQFIKDIGDTVEGFSRRRIMDERTEADKLFKEQTVALNERKQDFAEGADDRARAEAELERQRVSAQALSNLDAAQKAGGSRIDPFLANPEVQKLLTDQNILGEEAQRAKLMEFVGQDTSLFSDPTVLAETAYRNVLEGGGSPAQAEAEAKKRVSAEFPTLPSDWIDKLIAKPGGAGGSGSIASFAKSLAGTKGSSTPQQAIPSQLQSEELQKLLSDKMEIEGDRFSIFDFRPTDLASYGFGDHDLTESDVIGLQGEFSTELRPETILRTIQSLGDPTDGTLPFDPRSMSPQQRKDFLDVGRAVERKANEPRGGGTLGGNLGLADLLKLQQNQEAARQAYNMDLISLGTPQANTFEERLSGFRNFLGAPVQDTTRQGSGGGGVTTPETSTTGGTGGGGSTGSAGLDSLLADAAVEGNLGNTAIRPGDESPLLAQVISDSAGAPPGRGTQIAERAIIQPQINARVSELEKEIKTLEALPFQGAGVEETIRSMKEEIRDLKRRK